MKRTPNIWSAHHGEDNFINEYPDCSMFSFMEQTKNRHPDFTALEFQNNRMTFSEMFAQIELIAQSLLANGVKKGDYVSVVAPNTPQAVNMVYAINRIGAIANMIHPLLSQSEIKQLVENVNSKVMLTFDLVYPKIAEIEWKSPCNPLVIIAHISDALPFYLRAIYRLKAEKKIDYNPSHSIIEWKNFIKKGKMRKEALPVDDGKGEDVAIILYSGGTTGLPKGVMLQNFAFNAMAVQASEIKPLDTKDTAGKRVLALMPVFHGFGLAMCIHVMLSFGCHLFLVPKFDYKACAKLIFKKKLSYIYAVPALYEALSRTEEIEKADLSFMEMVAVGGDKCDKKLITRMNKYLEKGNSNARIIDAYGLTETVSGAIMNPFFALKEDSIGIPFPDNEVKIVKIGTQEEVPVGEDGELCISGPTRMLGYYNNEEETARVIQKHVDGKIWVHTGDICHVDEDGYVFYGQRHSRMIIVAGNNVYPTQIENVINQCDEVNTSCVIGVTGRASVQKIVAVVQPISMDIDLNALSKKILEVCEKNVADYARPQEVVFKEEMPKTAMGKVSFKKLIEEMEGKK